MQLYSSVADWPYLINYLGQRGTDMTELSPSRVYPDCFTRCNNSFIFNVAVGELFLDLYDRLPEETAYPLGQFLAAFCPALTENKLYHPPRDLPIAHQSWYATLAPDEVKRRLGLLDSVDLPAFLRHLHDFLRAEPDDVIAGPRDVLEFLFMWAAAFGQAAAKSWGLIVIQD